MRTIPIRTLGDLGPQHGEAVRVDGFPGRCRVLHTVSIRSMSYIGDVVIEASLAANPQEGDWRAVHTFTFDNTPSSQGVTLKGKFAWIRMRYDETLGELDSAIVR